MTRTLDDFDGRADEIEQTAAEWVARIDLHGTPEEWMALDAWLNESPRHRAAFLRLSVAWKRADQLTKLRPLSGDVDADLLDPAPRPLRVVGPTETPSSPDRNWATTRSYRANLGSSANGNEKISKSNTARLFGSSTISRRAASFALLAVVAGGGLGGSWYAIEQHNVDTYSTRVGEFHRVTLSDGTVVALNTNTEVKVRYTEEIRRVELVHGEALFEVAKNPARPFDVEAGDTTVRAVGTAFSVRLHEEDNSKRVDVVVSEGRVAINPPSKSTYPAGTVATVENGRIAATSVDSDDITGRLSWTMGRLVFQGDKLSIVVAEINRYNQRQLVITDPGIAGLHIGGTFHATDPDGFARALGGTFGIESRLVTQPFGKDVIRLDSGVP